MSGPDARAFRQALGQFPSGVCVTTCASPEGPQGMTMSSFNSLSLDPPLVLFSIDRRAASLPQWQAAAGYAVHVLAESQEALSNRFARPRSNKWEGVPWTAGHAGAPLLAGAACVFECDPFAQHDGGDHVLFLARVIRFSAHPDRRPLVFHQGRYSTLHKTDHAAALWPLDIHY